MKKISLLIVILIILAFTLRNNRSEYKVPRSATSIICCDIDLDDDIDIITGHKKNSTTGWGGLSILKNSGYGVFEMIDSMFIDYGFPHVNIDNFDNCYFPDVFGYHVSSDPYTIYTGILFNYGTTHFDDFKSYELSNDNPIYYFDSGDINNDGNVDIVFACNLGRYWGVIYNNGLSGFSTPLTYSVDFFPCEIACGDLNNDNRDDVVVSGLIQVFFSYPDGFQSLFLDVNNNDIKLTDFDNDGDLDILGSRDLFPYNYNLINMIENIGNDLFNIHEPLVVEKACHFQFVASDLNNDTLPDLIFHPMEKENLLLLYNENSFQLSEAKYIPMIDYGEGWRRSACADLDGNGYNDIATIRYIHSNIPANLNILFNDGKGNFVEYPITSLNDQYKLSQNSLICYPNPFIHETVFEFQIKKESNVELIVYNLQGKAIKCLTHKKMKGGKYKIKWNGLAENNAVCKPGSYIAYLKANGKILHTLKLIKY